MNNPISLKPGWQGIYAISGVPNESGKTFLISHVASPQILTEGILWFTRDINEAKKISALLNFWLQPKLKTPVIIPEEANRPLVLQSLKTDKPNIIIFPFDFFNQPVVALETLKQKTLLLKPNQRYTPAELSQKLILTGYEYNTTTDVPGSFSRRGNIVDIFPQDSSHPLRLEFNQTTIDQLMEFQEFTGKTIRSLDQALIIPARLDHYEASGRWYDYLKSIGHRWIVYSDPDELESVSTQWSEIQRVVKKLPQIVFYSLPNPEVNNEFDFKNAPLYHRDFTNCFAHLNDWRVSGFKIIFPD